MKGVFNYGEELLNPMKGVTTYAVCVMGAFITYFIIGGADGPTQIMVARAVNPISDWIFDLIGVIAAGIGIYATRCK